jgi:alpha-tubulin suppressor-like RCC1 family protein
VIQQIDRVGDITDVCAGRYASSLISNGCLYLLQGNQAIKIETTISKILKIAIGKSMACVLDEKGFVWTWGENSQGELGLGDTLKRDLPAPVLSLKGRNITSIACGGRSVICLG